MADFRNYQFTYSEVSAIAVDTNTGQFLWIAFTLKDGTCRLQKVSARDITQVYFTLELAVTSINSIKVLDDYLYVAVTHATTAVYVYNTTTPLSNVTLFTKTDLSISESPIAIAISATIVYILTPGLLSGEEAKLITFNVNGSFIETVDLLESGLMVTNAVSLTVDSNDNIWIVTSSDPSSLYRVFYSGTWQLQETILT